MSGPLFPFLEAHQDVDVFCFQEVFDEKGRDMTALFEAAAEGTLSDLHARLSHAMPGHVGIFLPVWNDSYGIATFVRREIGIAASGSISLYENPNFPEIENDDADHPRSALRVDLIGERGGLKVVNVHGHWVPSNKSDTPARLEQSRRLITAVGENPQRTVLCGDFNLRPDTESVRMIESAGFRNLVAESGVTSTRTGLYKKEERFADYAFVTPDLEVEHFQILPDEVSDHAPLLVEILDGSE